MSFDIHEFTGIVLTGLLNQLQNLIDDNFKLHIPKDNFSSIKGHPKTKSILGGPLKSIRGVLYKPHPVSGILDQNLHLNMIGYFCFWNYQLCGLQPNLTPSNIFMVNTPNQ